MALPTPKENTTAIVTGASSGIGAEIARELARRGHGLTLVARRADRLQALADELAHAHAVRAEVIAADLTDADSRGALPAQLDARGLNADILVNNAGFTTMGAVYRADRAAELALVRTNVEAVVDLCTLFVPGMVTRHRGAVLNTASTAAFQPLPGQAGYGASKAFVLSYGRALRAELRGTGVTVDHAVPRAGRDRLRRGGGHDRRGGGRDTAQVHVDPRRRRGPGRGRRPGGGTWRGDPGEGESCRGRVGPCRAQSAPAPPHGQTPPRAGARPPVLNRRGAYTGSGNLGASAAHATPVHGQRGLMPHLVSDLNLPYLDTIGLERREAIDAITAARSVHWLARSELGYSVTRLQDVTAIFRDQRFHSALSMIERSPELQDAGVNERHVESILTMEGPGHARLRRLVAPAFTPASANRLRPTMQRVVGELVDRVAARGECELVADVCEPYPIPIICELLGAPPEDWKLFSGWATDIFRIFNGNLVEDLPFIVRAGEELTAYVSDMITARRSDPRRSAERSHRGRGGR